MAIPYRPRIIRKEGTDWVYLMTCKKDLASDLVKWLVEKGIPASLSGTETNEEMEYGDESESYVVSEIEISPPSDLATTNAAVDEWLAKS